MRLKDFDRYETVYDRLDAVSKVPFSMVESQTATNIIFFWVEYKLAFFERVWQKPNPMRVIE